MKRNQRAEFTRAQAQIIAAQHELLLVTGFPLPLGAVPPGAVISSDDLALQIRTLRGMWMSEMARRRAAEAEVAQYRGLRASPVTDDRNDQEPR
jgi:hypothetical protein